jgi:hypothetical protein
MTVLFFALPLGYLGATSKHRPKFSKHLALLEKNMATFQNNVNLLPRQRAGVSSRRSSSIARVCTEPEEVRTRAKKGDKEIIYFGRSSESDVFFCLHLYFQEDLVTAWIDDDSEGLDQCELLEEFYKLLIELFGNFQIQYLVQGMDIHRKVIEKYHEEGEEEGSLLNFFENCATSFVQATMTIQ